MSGIDAQITFLGSTDLERTSEFYETVLGLPLVVDQGRCRIHRATGGAFLGFCEHLPVAEDGPILTLVTDDVPGFHARLLERGVAVESAPSHREEFGIVHFFLRDPDGHRIEIQRFDDPGWSRSDS